MKRFVMLLSLLAILCGGISAAKYAYQEIPVSYDGRDVDVTKLYENPSEYDNSNPDGVASIIVNENLDKTMAANAVAAVVFDFRGFDTLGESFILLTAIAGCYVIFDGFKNPKKKSGEEEEA